MTRVPHHKGLFNTCSLRGPVLQVQRSFIPTRMAAAYCDSGAVNRKPRVVANKKAESKARGLLVHADIRKSDVWFCFYHADVC